MRHKQGELLRYICGPVAYVLHVWCFVMTVLCVATITDLRDKTVSTPAFNNTNIHWKQKTQYKHTVERFTGPHNFLVPLASFCFFL
jgi:hypothetical protein